MVRCSNSEALKRGKSSLGSQLGVVTEKLAVVRKFNVVRTLSLTL